MQNTFCKCICFYFLYTLDYAYGYLKSVSCMLQYIVICATGHNTKGKYMIFQIK